jgi:hypothetical protein
MTNGGLYAKVALGYYSSDYSPGPDRWGFGGFAGLGFETGNNGVGFEVGYQMGPEVSGVNNQGFYGVVTFRM